MDGWEATRRLKEDPATQAVPILVVSGHAFGAAEKRARNDGANAFLTKPCLPADLAAKVGNMLAPPPVTSDTVRTAALPCTTEWPRAIIRTAIERCERPPIVIRG
jgi:CheY-like chemotaxis protein